MSVEPDHAVLPPPTLTPAPRVLILAAPYHRAIVEALASGADAQLNKVGASVDRIDLPGALELPIAVRMASESRRYDGYIALGCVIRGETTHYEIVSNESAAGLMQIGLQRSLAIGNGILTVENRAQAEERADPARLDKGGEAALACLHLIAAKRRFGDAPAPSSDELLLA